MNVDCDCWMIDCVRVNVRCLVVCVWWCSPALVERRVTSYTIGRKNYPLKHISNRRRVGFPKKVSLLRRVRKKVRIPRQRTIPLHRNRHPNQPLLIRHLLAIHLHVLTTIRLHEMHPVSQKHVSQPSPPPFSHNPRPPSSHHRIIQHHHHLRLRVRLHRDFHPHDHQLHALCFCDIHVQIRLKENFSVRAPQHHNDDMSPTNVRTCHRMLAIDDRNHKLM